MSHFTTIKTQIKDIAALRSACQEMGLALLQNAEARGYYENKTKGDYVIRLKGPYDIALNKQPDGSFGLTADLWLGHEQPAVTHTYVQADIKMKQECMKLLEQPSKPRRNRNPMRFSRLLSFLEAQ